MIDGMENSFSATSRPDLIRRAGETTFDVLVIGGGITGAGIALDATVRGLSVALIEMQDFAAGTSGRSTRLIHGGLRYLKQLEFGLVAEVARERKIIQRNAPHLVKPEPLLLPVMAGGSPGRFTAGLGMRLYEMLAGVNREERHRSLNAAEVLHLEPLLKKKGLLGGILYFEYRTDDARLTMSVVKEAVHRGALALSYMKATAFLKEKGKVTGVTASDQLDEGTYEIRATQVINASGPWVDDLDHMDDGKQGNKLVLTKGVHLVFDRGRLPLQQSVYFNAPDQRMIFALPHRGKTYVGTTDTFYDGDKIHPQVTDEDAAYLLQCLSARFNLPGLGAADIESSWAGIRPMIRKAGKRPSEISRRDEVFVSDSGLISIAGGKLTGYRKMAKRVMDLVSQKMTASARKKVERCSTEQVVLWGGNFGQAGFSAFEDSKLPLALALGLSRDSAADLFRRYGSETDRVLILMNEYKKKNSAVAELSFLLHAELVYAITHEMCLTPSDFFIRRTGMLYFDIAAVSKYKAGIIKCMKGLLNWSDHEERRHKKDLELRLTEAKLA